MIKTIISKIWRSGNSYVVTVPMDLFRQEDMKEGIEVKVTIETGYDLQELKQRELMVLREIAELPEQDFSSPVPLSVQRHGLKLVLQKIQMQRNELESQYLKTNVKNEPSMGSYLSTGRAMDSDILDDRGAINFQKYHYLGLNYEVTNKI